MNTLFNGFRVYRSGPISGSLQHPLKPSVPKENRFAWLPLLKSFF